MRGIVFDLDDTLYPQARFVRSGFAAVAHHAGRQFGVPPVRAFTVLLKAAEAAPGRELQVLCETFGLRAGLVAELLQVFRTHRPELWLAHTGLETLRRLRADGWRIAVLTNGLPHVQAAKVHALGLPALVDHVVYAAEYAESGKPGRGAFAEAVRRIGLPAQACVMVGNDPGCDISGGRDAGLRTILVRTTHTGVDGGADIVVEHLADVPAAAASLVVEMARAHAA